MAEKDKLLRDMDQCKSQLCVSAKDTALDSSNMYDNRSSYIEEIKVRPNKIVLHAHVRFP